MTTETASLGDLCACGDLAHPGRDLCSACLADRQAEREWTSMEASRLTSEHEALVSEED